MKRLALAIGLAAALTAGSARSDTITDWNMTAITVMNAANVAGHPWSRSLAMMHVAMADAVNAIEGRHARLHDAGPPAPKASAPAAAATAAHRILVKLYPARKDAFDAAHAASIKALPDSAGVAEGIAIGERAAAAVEADRANDGTNAPDTHRPVTSPGVWIPTTPPLMAQYARARPWVLKSADQFRPGPPPALASEAYARDYNETKALGGARSAARTAAQSDIVKFWTQFNIAPAWQVAARELSAAKGLDLADNARLFALLNVALFNSFIIDWDAKFTYNFWRPVTAIRNGDTDSNDATERDAGWTPSNATPMHPEYPSQASMISGGSVAILESVFGPNPQVPFTVVDSANPQLTRRYESIAQLAREQADVRVWGGIHFRTSLEVGARMARESALYLIDNAFKPTR
jgi:hypothetical protein